MTITSLCCLAETLDRLIIIDRIALAKQEDIVLGSVRQCVCQSSPV